MTEPQRDGGTACRDGGVVLHRSHEVRTTITAPTTCHPERRMRASVVEAVGRERSEPSKRRGATATKGSRNEFGWLSIGNVTFPMNGYREIVRRSCSMLRISHFCLFGASHPQPAKVRLRASPFAQDDVLVACFLSLARSASLPTSERGDAVGRGEPAPVRTPKRRMRLIVHARSFRHFLRKCHLPLGGRLGCEQPSPLLQSATTLTE